MESLQTLVRNLAIIILLASFLEMLLPNQSMRGFVKLIMGLFVISAVLSPVASLLHLPQEMDIPAWTEVAPRDLPVLAGNNGTQIGRDAVQEQFKLILKHEIESLVLGISGIDAVEAEVSLKQNAGAASAGGLMDQPQVDRVVIRINPSTTVIESVKPITIGQQEPVTQAESIQADEIKAKVASLLQIPEERIFITGS